MKAKSGKKILNSMNSQEFTYSDLATENAIWEKQLT